jgi:hypothetical protein
MGTMEGAVEAAQGVLKSVLTTVDIANALTNPVSMALAAYDAYPDLKAAYDFLRGNVVVLFALVVDWPATVARLLVALETEYVDDFFRLTGQAEEQGRYVGRIVGRAFAELYIFVVGLIPGLQELIFARAARAISEFATAVETIADGFRSLRGLPGAGGIGTAVAGAVGMAASKSGAALQQLQALGAELVEVYGALGRIRWERDGELAAECARVNRLTEEINALVVASDDAELRALWLADWQEWRLNSHHGIEYRFLQSNNLSADVRGFFEFLGWRRRDDMWAVPLPEVTHIRKPATAMGYLKNATPLSPHTVNPETGQAFLLTDYTTWSRELTAAIGEVEQYSTAEQLLKRVSDLLCRQEHDQQQGRRDHGRGGTEITPDVC